MRRLFAYASEQEVHANGSDPHAVRILVSNKDYQLHQEMRIRENAYLSRYQIGSYITVTDQRGGLNYKIASAPCGLGCRCAAVAILVCSECEREDGIMTDSGLCVTCHTRLNGEDDAGQ